MNSTGALMIVVGIFIIGRLVTKDSHNQTLAGRLAGGQPDFGGGSGSSSSGAGKGARAAAIAAPGAKVLGSVTPSELNSIARRMGWSAAQVNDWEAVITRESGGNPNAQNPTSSAYGIAQGITGRVWYYQHGGNPNTVMGQLVAMANYIKSRYGTPAGALAHEYSAGWY